MTEGLTDRQKDRHNRHAMNLTDKLIKWKSRHCTIVQLYNNATTHPARNGFTVCFRWRSHETCVSLEGAAVEHGRVCYARVCIMCIVLHFAISYFEKCAHIGWCTMVFNAISCYVNGLSKIILCVFDGGLHSHKHTFPKTQTQQTVFFWTNFKNIKYFWTYSKNRSVFEIMSKTCGLFLK